MTYTANSQALQPGTLRRALGSLFSFLRAMEATPLDYPLNRLDRLQREVGELKDELRRSRETALVDVREGSAAGIANGSATASCLVGETGDNLSPLGLEGGKCFPLAGSSVQRSTGCPFNVRMVAMTVRTNDYDEIVGVIQLYIDGFNDNDIGKFRRAFHEDAWIFFIDADGAMHKSPISEWFESWAQPPGLGVVGRFFSVTQVGDVASVQVSFDRTADPSQGWIDFHNLIRVNGVWKITNKTATHSSR